MNMNKDMTIVILSLVIAVLVGFIIFGYEKESEKIISPVLKEGSNTDLSIKQTLTTLKEDVNTDSDINDWTEEDCIRFAKDTENKYENCVKLGSTRVYKNGEEEVDCISNHSDAPVFCTYLTTECRDVFPQSPIVLADCLYIIQNDLRKEKYSVFFRFF